MFSKFIFLISEGARSIIRDKVSSIISCLALAVSLFILSLAYFCAEYLMDQKDKITQDYEIEVFFNNCITLENENPLCYQNCDNENADCNKEYIQLLTKWFKNKLLDDRIYNGEFIDKNKSAIRFKEKFGEDIEEIFNYNPLPISSLFALNPKSRNEDEIKNLINEISKDNTLVNDVVSDFDTINSVEKITNIFFAILLIVELIIVIVVVFYISNTIQLVVYSKKDDMEVLKLLGASNNFIRFPYIFEGITYGFIGSVISLSSIFMLNYLLLYLFDFNILNITQDSFLVIILINVLIGPFLGFIASSKALTSYIKN